MFHGNVPRTTRLKELLALRRKDPFACSVRGFIFVKFKYLLLIHKKAHLEGFKPGDRSALCS